MSHDLLSTDQMAQHDIIAAASLGRKNHRLATSIVVSGKAALMCAHKRAAAHLPHIVEHPMVKVVHLHIFPDSRDAPAAVPDARVVSFDAVFMDLDIGAFHNVLGAAEEEAEGGSGPP